MTWRAPLLSLLALGSSGCADIDYFSPGTCGNGVVEPGTEDCDTSVPAGLGAGCGLPSDSVRACRLTCNADGECPHGWSCAPDQACVRPSGVWTETSPLALTLDDWSLLDLDSDGRADIAGMRGGELHATFGDGEGGFVEPRVRHVDRVGPATFRSAIAVPTPEGVAVFAGDPARALAPRPLAYDPEALTLPTANARMIWGLPVELPLAFGAKKGDGCRGAIALNADIADDVVGRVFDVPNASGEAVLFQAISNVCPAGSEQSCIGNAAVVLPRAESTPATRGGSVLLCPPKHDRVSVVSAQLGTSLDPGLKGATHEVALPSGHTVSPHALPVSFTPGSGSAEILIPTCDAGLQKWVRTLRQPDGSLDPFELDARFGGVIGSPCGEGPVLLAADDLNGDGMGDYVFSDRVLVSAADGELVSADLPLLASWREAAVGDFDGDERLDLAAVRADSQRLDVLYSAGCEPVCGWSNVPIDVAGEPHLVRAANLDGVGGDDLAFVVSTSANDRVHVAFATGAALAPPKTVAVLEGIQRMEASRFRSTLGYCDTAVDLGISRLKGPVAGFTLLMGSGHGELYAPLAFGASGVIDPVVSVVLANSATVGRPWLFAEAEGGLYAVVDVLRGGAVGATRLGSFVPVTCQVGGSAPKSAFLWSPADLDGDGVDEVVGVERRCADSGVSTDTRVLTARAEETTVREQHLSAPALELSEILVHDFDGDAALDLALLHADGLSIHWADSDGGWSSNAPLELPLKQARSMAVLQADEVPGYELALLSADGLVVLSFAGRAVVEAPRGVQVSDGKRVRVGDVNGDTIHDFLVSGDQYIRVLLGVPHRPIAR